MVALTHNCPHCGTERAGFSSVGEAYVPDDGYIWHIFFRCNACFGPLVVVAHNDDPRIAPSQRHGDLAGHRNFSDLKFFPKSTPSSSPPHIPDAISRAFIQAEDAIKRRHWEAAGAMDRRALEIATKEMAPEHAQATLYQRIEKLAGAGKLTESLKEWAHELRLVGNDAVHDVDGVDEKEAIQAHELTRFILIYLYTLPAQVEQAMAGRANAG